MKRLIVFFILSFSGIILLGQKVFRLSGGVLNEKEVPIAYTNVSLRDTLTHKVYGGVTDETGQFSIENIPCGIYHLKISFIGYKPFEQILSIQNNLDIGKHKLSLETKNLEEVTVTHALPRIEYNVDRYIVNIENSLAATGKTVTELLSMSPGVWASPDGSIRINGIPGVTVMVNNRPVNLSGKVLLEYLRSFRSEDIAKIEIIPQPSAEYEAEGLGGIINIITRKKTQQGWKGRIGTTFYKHTFSGIAPFVSIGYMYDKLSLQFNASGNLSKWLLLLSDDNLNRNTGQGYFSTGEDTIRDKNLSTTMNIFYEINEKNSVGIRMYHLFWNKEEVMRNLTRLTDHEELTGLLKTDHMEDQHMNTTAYTLNYKWHIDTLGRTIKILADYTLQYKYNTFDTYRYLSTDKNMQQVLNDENHRSTKKRPYRLYSAKFDYVHPFNKKFTFDAGTKYSFVDLNDEMQYDSLSVDGLSWIPFSQRSYRLYYQEHLIAGYMQTTYKIPTMSIRVGLRGEYTKYRLNKDDGFNSYNHFFPSVFVNKKLDQKNNHSINASYAKRIRRISYFWLTPNRFYADKYERLEGNPNLKPEIIHTFKIGYSLQNKYIASLSYSINRNKLSRFAKTDQENLIINTYKDGGKEHALSGNIYVPIDIFKWWKTINQLSFYYDYFHFDERKIKQKNLEIYTQHYITFPANIQLDVLYKYNSPSISGYTRYKAYHLLNLAVQKKIWDGKFVVKLDVQRLLWNQKSSFHVSGEPVEYTKRFYHKSLPYFSLGVIYNFKSGKSKRTPKIEKSNKEELQRTY